MKYNTQDYSKKLLNSVSLYERQDSHTKDAWCYRNLSHRNLFLPTLEESVKLDRTLRVKARTEANKFSQLNFINRPEVISVQRLERTMVMALLSII